MALFYTDIGTIQNDPLQISNKRVSSLKVTGNMHSSVVVYTSTAVPVDEDYIRLIKLPPGIIIHPHLCRWKTSVLLDSAAVNLVIGDDHEWTHITPDEDRYMLSVDVVDADDQFQWAPDGAAVTGPAGAVTPYVTTKAGWIDARIKTATGALAAGGVITFWIYWSTVS
jgi:hypothetical protein